MDRENLVRMRDEYQKEFAEVVKQGPFKVDILNRFFELKEKISNIDVSLASRPLN